MRVCVGVLGGFHCKVNIFIMNFIRCEYTSIILDDYNNMYLSTILHIFVTADNFNYLYMYY